MQLGFTYTGDAIEIDTITRPYMLEVGLDDMMLRCDRNVLYPTGHACNEFTNELENAKIRDLYPMPDFTGTGTSTKTNPPTTPVKPVAGAAGVCGTPWIDGFSNCYLILGAVAVSLGLLMISRR